MVTVLSIFQGIDCNGHGTHCAGTVGSYRYGIARQANLFGVRVLSCIGFGSTGSIVKGKHAGINIFNPNTRAGISQIFFPLVPKQSL